MTAKREKALIQAELTDACNELAEVYEETANALHEKSKDTTRLGTWMGNDGADREIFTGYMQKQSETSNKVKVLSLRESELQAKLLRLAYEYLLTLKD